MYVKALPLGSLQANCYLLKDPASGECALVDPGVYDSTLENFLASEGVSEIKYVMLTHGHFDHICGAYHIREKYGAKILIHEEDALCLHDGEWSIANYVDDYELFFCEADICFVDGDKFYLGETEISVMHTPGHSRGSSMFIADGYIFAGDTILFHSMGRTDLYGGSTKTIFKSLRLIGQMQGEYIIAPGHGQNTTLSEEKRFNRYLRANDTSNN